MVRVFEYALDQFEYTLAIRLNLYLPKDHQDEILAIICDYFERLEEKLNTDALAYLWRKRADKVSSYNYQVMLFLDYDLYFGSAICWDTRNQLAKHLRDAWDEAIEAHYKGKERSLVVI